MSVSRQALPEDAAALAGLAERTFRATFGAQNPVAEVDRHCAAHFSPELQAREIADPRVTTLVVEQEGGLVAFAQLRTGPPPDGVSAPGPIELWRFYLAADRQGTGLAQALMAETLESARQSGARTVWLGVWEENPRAIRFYRKCGFSEAGAHTFWFGSDPQRDLVFTRPLSAAARSA